MTDKQMETIVTLIGGIQLAIVHLSNVLCKTTSMERQTLAESFEATAETLPAEVNNRELIQTILRQISSGIRSSKEVPDFETSLRKIFH